MLQGNFPYGKLLLSIHSNILSLAPVQLLEEPSESQSLVLYGYFCKKLFVQKFPCDVHTIAKFILDMQCWEMKNVYPSDLSVVVSIPGNLHICGQVICYLFLKQSIICS